MSKKITVNLAEGLGNQMFMYAAAYSLAKNKNYNLYIDIKSSYYKKKEIREYNLDIFNISAKIADDNTVYNNFYKNLKKKFLKNLDYFNKNKNFLIEKKNNNKDTFFYNLDSIRLSNNVYMQGNFESELYFIKDKNLLKNEFSIKSDIPSNSYNNLLNGNNPVVSVALRQERFSERVKHKNYKISKSLSDNFLIQQLNYINRAVLFCKQKLNNPIFLVFSNNSHNLANYFDCKKEKFVLVETHQFGESKFKLDMYLMLKCRNFIVAPSTFHWWPAWLNYKNQNDTLVLRPKDLNVSKNKDYWPEDWISI
jgi:hypothetical protein